MDQPARMAALDRFRRGEAELLIASDVAARGLDIPEVSHVFNFDVPHHADDYVHRIGRTGRAGRSGTAITIVAPIDNKAVHAIERLIGQTIPWMDKPAASETSATPSPREHGQRPHAKAPRGRNRGRGPARQAKKNTPAPKAPSYQPAQESDGGHLPAFLLRPVPIKA
jgi:superfamily II DNA/RNA helicase